VHLLDVMIGSEPCLCSTLSIRATTASRHPQVDLATTPMLTLSKARAAAEAVAWPCKARQATGLFVRRGWMQRAGVWGPGSRRAIGSEGNSRRRRRHPVDHLVVLRPFTAQRQCSCAQHKGSGGDSQQGWLRLARAHGRVGRAGRPGRGGCAGELRRRTEKGRASHCRTAPASAPARPPCAPRPCAAGEGGRATPTGSAGACPRPCAPPALHPSQTIPPAPAAADGHSRFTFTHRQQGLASAKGKNDLGRAGRTEGVGRATGRGGGEGGGYRQRIQ
jgi:hypothetical protein